jgi:uncharacterized lipoprotein YajG
MRKVLSLALIFLITSCGTVALEPAHVRLAPDIPLVTVNLGRGAQVFLRAMDARPEKIADVQKKYVEVAPILPVENLGQMLQDLFAKRLSALGFELLIAPNALSTRLDIASKKLEYGRYSTDPPLVHIDASMTVAVYKNNTCVFDRNYSRIYEEESPAMGPNASWLEERSNIVLSQLIEKILADLELLAALK